MNTQQSKIRLHIIIVTQAHGAVASCAYFFNRRVRRLLYRIQNRQELDSLAMKLPNSIRDEAFRSVAFPSEGLALIAENADDICEARKIVDFISHPAEWVNRLDGNFLSALFVMSNSFVITLFMPADVAPATILKEAED